MTEKNYFLNIYNTMTGEFELVQVTKEVFQTYRRTKWHIEDSTERFYKHETQMSSLIEYSARDCAPQPLKLSIHSSGIEHPCRCR